MDGTKAPAKTLSQFYVTDRKLLIQDVEFWASTTDALLQFYKETMTLSADDLGVKAIACARMAGLGAAMVEHFSAGIDALIDTSKENADLEACEETGVRIYEMCDHHTKRLEAQASVQVN